MLYRERAAAGSYAAAMPERARTRNSLRDRMVPPYYPEFFRGAGWILPLIITVIGGVLRFWNLVRPDSVIFDETYYAKDGWSMYTYGWEHAWQDTKTADPAFAGTGSGGFGAHGAVQFSCAQQCPEFVVHPPFGKWVIGAGEQIWGPNPVGWRLMEAALGTLAIYVLARTGRRMFRSTLLGCVAGILLCFDGLAFVMARTALLDGVQMFFILAGFSALVVDRDKTRSRLAHWREELGAGSPLGKREPGPRLGPRPWRLLAGLSLGLACATKWNAVFFVAAFAVMSVLWDRGARRAIGVHRPSVATLRRDAPWAFASIPVTAATTFVASYAGWFLDTANGGGWDRFWAAHHPPAGFPDLPMSRTVTGWIPDALRSLWFYIHQQYQASVNITTPHGYQSNPWSWLVLGRPVTFYVGQPGCTPKSGVCSEVLALGNPALWWFATASIPVLFWRWIGRRDWRAAAILTAIAAGMVPWMHYAHRTIFSFYAVAFAPFVVLGATMALGVLLGREDASAGRRFWGASASGTMLVATVAVFAYFYPLYTGQAIPYPDWESHMWLPSWI